MCFNTPPKIQQTALPTRLADPPQNMIAQSQSGKGKTAAFVLAMISRVGPLQNYPQMICLSPTYDLAIQKGEVAAKMAKFCPEIKLRYAVRGEEIVKGAKLTNHIVPYDHPASSWTGHTRTKRPPEQYLLSVAEPAAIDPLWNNNQMLHISQLIWSQHSGSGNQPTNIKSIQPPQYRQLQIQQQPTTPQKRTT
ncbi:DEAD-box helicase Dbp80-like [Topomyia yanbarensis]|uniref:DEAD-box helicase Dbp80-like n=1 Tax=Topomyia yanbarensis TaxID=2498891 RepID=UPI00273C5D4F|nr:DEAD-box helicase Dbp80-like [Topomyia yanbarensis]